MGFSYNVNVLNQKGSPALYTDTFANRPPFGYAGRLFIANDTSAIYEDTGTSWVLIANVSSGAGTLQQVTTNGNTSNVGISITAGGLSTNSLTDTALTLGSVLFSGAAGLVTQDNAAFFWDDTNNRLGLNTVTPSNTLDIHFAGTGASIGINNTAGNPATIVFANTGANKWRIGNSSTNTFDVINIGTATNAISINGSTNLVSLIGALNAVGSITSQSNGSTFGTSGNGALPLIVQANAVGRAIQLKNISAGTGSIAATGTASTMNFSFETFSTPDAFIINNDGSASHSGDLSLTKGTTRNLNFYDNLAVNINAQIQYSEVNSNTGQLLFLTNNAGTLATRLTISNTGAASFTANVDILGGGLASTNGLHMWFNTSTNICWIQGFQSGVDWRQINYNGAIHNFLINDVSAMYVSNGRNVLIGSTTDNTVDKLQVIGSTYLDNKLKVQTTRTLGTITIDTLLNAGYNGIDIKTVQSPASGAFIQFRNLSDVSCGNITHTTALTVAYNTASDYRLKQDLKDFNGIDLINSIKVYDFEWIEDKKRMYGVIAHEIKDIIPYAVSGEKDAEKMQGFDYSFLTPILTKAIQEQQNIINSLIKRIEELENK
jgi:hypothetical protein